MSDDNAVFTATMKAGPGYEAPWLVVRGNTPKEFEDAMKAVWSDNLGGMVIATATALQEEYRKDRQAAAKTGPVETVVQAVDGQVIGQQAASPTATTAAPTASAPPPSSGPTAPQCAHGEMTFRSGTSKTGRPWQAYFCPTPKGTPGQCEAVWPNSPLWPR